MTDYQYQRSIPRENAFDVIVAGGGPAGTAAAISAARQGMKVLLLEATGCLGGMGTSALVSQWSHTSTGDGPVIGGLIREWIEALYQRGEIQPGIDADFWNYEHNRGFGFHAEGLKRLLDELCESAGVEVRFFSRVIDADVDRNARQVQGVIIHDIEGLHYIPAKAFIDATGDAVLADLCGADYLEAGRDTPNIMPPTLCSLVAGVDFQKFDRRTMQFPALDQALKEGFFSQPDRHVPGLFRAGQSWGTLNAGHLFKTNAVKQESLTEAMRWGRRLAKEYTDFYRQYLPGCEQAELVATASLLGVRESRRVVGEYMLNYDDYRARRHFPDQIAIYCKQVDIHVYDLTEEEYERYRKEFTEDDTLKHGESYGIPYGSLVPRGWQNLWAAGRCSSSDIKVNGAIRDQPGCAMMGQAAGTAAAQAIRTGQTACTLDTAQLVTTLREQGANLPQAELAKQMTKMSDQ